MSKFILLFTLFLSFVSFSQNDVSFSQMDNLDWDIDTPAIINADAANFEPTVLPTCNKCICIRVFSPTKQFQDKAKALYFSHRCPDPCKGCSIAGGNSSMEWKEHYKRVYPNAGMVSIERSSYESTIKNCGCNPSL